MEKPIVSTTEDMEKIAEELMKADLIYIFPHFIPDGDAMGSSAAVCGAMRALGKSCYIIMEDKYPDNLAFLDEGFCKTVGEGDMLPAPDLALAIDCSDLSRFPKRTHIYNTAGVTACIDHHMTRSGCGTFNYIDPYAAAACELAYMLLKDILHLTLDKQQAEAIYTGILTDTGNFEFSNTTAKTHMITADLYSCGIDSAGINIKIHQNESLEKIKLHSRVLDGMTTLCEGKVALATCTLDILSELGADDSETDGITSSMRNVKGVEIAAFLRERPGGVIKCGFRSKSVVNVAEFSAKFGGGGHVRASGCTMSCSLEEAVRIISEEAVKTIEAAGL